MARNDRPETVEHASKLCAADEGGADEEGVDEEGGADDEGGDVVVPRRVGTERRCVQKARVGRVFETGARSSRARVGIGRVFESCACLNRARV
jgi:hypothetical protein